VVGCVLKNKCTVHTYIHRKKQSLKDHFRLYLFLDTFSPCQIDGPRFDKGFFAVRQLQLRRLGTRLPDTCNIPTASSMRVWRARLRLIRWLATKASRAYLLRQSHCTHNNTMRSNILYCVPNRDRKGVLLKTAFPGRAAAEGFSPTSLRAHLSD